MKFNNTLPEWKNEGIAPSENLRTNGFQAGDKPAAATFNWFWSKIPKVVTEIQDGLNNVEKNVNGLSKISHTHSNKSVLDNITATQYTGNSNTATKLQTAREINKVAFDGSKNITIPINGCFHFDNTSNAAASPWHKVASCTMTASNDDRYAVFHVYRSVGSSQNGGILKAHVRTNVNSGYESSYLVWEYAYDITKENFVLSITEDKTNKTVAVELWVRIPYQYNGYQFTMIAETNRTNLRKGLWTLYNSSSGQAAYTESDIVTASDLLKLQNPAGAVDSGWVRIGISGGNGELYYRKYGKMIELKGSASPHNGGEWTVGTLPEGYRPSTTDVTVYAIGNSPRALTISTGGAVTVSDVGVHEYIRLHACFLID